MQGPGQGSTEQYMPLPTGQPGASGSLGCSGCVPPRCLLASRVQLSPEPHGVVVIATWPTALPVRRSMALLQNVSHCHSIVFTAARENAGAMREGVYVCETRETK